MGFETQGRLCDRGRFQLTKDQYSDAYRHGFKLTLRFLLSRGLPYDTAEETAQAAWTRGWERLSQLRDSSLVFTWANSIALNMYRSLRRQEPRREGLTGLSTSPAPNLAKVDVEQILDRCRREDRDILQSYYLDGYLTSEIAAERGVSETAVRIRLMRARRAANQEACAA